jgi:hypothetical protein
VSAEEVDRYLAEIEEPKRATLQKLRDSVLRGCRECFTSAFMR